MFYDGWKRASARLGRPSHPSALLPSWTGACRALGGSGKEWAHKTHLDSLAYPPSCYVAKLGPRVGSSRSWSHSWQTARFQHLCPLPASSSWSHGGTQMLKLAGLGEAELRAWPGAGLGGQDRQ